MTGQTGEIVLYQRDDGTANLEVRLVDDTVWLTQAQMADLFQTTQQNISLHLRNVYDEGELATEATYKDFLLVRVEGQRQVKRSVAHYSLDAVNFFATAQNKLHFAAHGHTADEVSRKQAHEKAHAEYAEFVETLSDVPSEVEEAYLESIRQVGQQIEGGKP